MRYLKKRFVKASGLALVSLGIWTAVTIVRLASGMVVVDNWLHWTMLLIVSFTSAALFGSAVTLAIDAHSQRHPRSVILSEDYEHPEDEGGKA